MLLWTILCLGSAAASSIPNPHKLRLPFVPSSHNLEDGVKSRLSISLSIQNGSLYANEHQVYPPSEIMQLHAPLYEFNPSDKTVELSYTLETQTLPTDEMESTADMIRVRVEWFDLQGSLVSPDAVVVDLLAFQNGKYEMTRIRVEPARGSDEGDHVSQKSQTWVMNYWRTQFGSIFDKSKIKSKTTTTPTRDSVPVTESSARNRAIKVISSKDTTDSGSETRFFSFWATPAHLHHHAEHRRPHHDRHHKNTFMRIIHPIILPALLGTAAGLVACLVGFFVGELLMSLGVRLGWQKVLGDRSRIISVEEGTVSEKTPMVPHVYVTDTAESDV
ncbi:hypothetical protein PENFLA_c023G11067 [Penicillium flavigenum]|uniref:Uncharacterized protein n=1 Tax=Penicillium flavigenum TaxID=254877 RepID=A0A1V6SUX0_9EURO|nr:hypothetical protein PENFLA_c023G11067 [Penicillium flavigenum]